MKGNFSFICLLSESINSFGSYKKLCFKSSFNLYFPYETLIILFSASILFKSTTRDPSDMFCIPDRTTFSRSFRVNNPFCFLAISIIWFTAFIVVLQLHRKVITNLANINVFCRYCYIFNRGNSGQHNKYGKYWSYLPILLYFIRFYNYHPSANCTNCEILRLTCRFYFPLQSYSGERTSSTVPLIGFVELTTTFHNFRQVEIGYFINSSAIYLPYPSFPAVSSLHVKFRTRQESR